MLPVLIIYDAPRNTTSLVSGTDHCLTVKTKEAAAEVPSKFSADDSPISACMREVPSEINVVHSGKAMAKALWTSSPIPCK